MGGGGTTVKNPRFLYCLGYNILRITSAGNYLRKIVAYMRILVTTYIAMKKLLGVNNIIQLNLPQILLVDGEYK